MFNAKRTVALTLVVLLLSACAQAPSSTSSRSNVEVYGEVDVGVGTQQIRN